MKINALLVVAVVIGAVVVAEGKTRWFELDGYTFDRYVSEFGKRYDTPQEYESRKAIFEKTLNEIKQHNADPRKSWKEGVNHFTDRTPEEFRRLLGYKKTLNVRSHLNQTVATSVKLLKDLPTDVDWRNHSIVSDVKDQGQCGSCWSFAAAETIESHYAAKTGILNVLSEQNILDCVANPDECGGTGGCSGGTAQLAYDALTKQGGIAAEWTYPYISYHGASQTCKQQPAVVRLNGYTQIPHNDFNSLMTAIATIGPIAISVEASYWSRYETGVFDGCNQVNPDINHAVQLVGYGSEDGKNYWLVRNSWSPAWGDKGYIKILRADNEATRCGTDIHPQDGSGCKGGPSQVTTCGTCGILYDNCYPTIA